MLRFYPGYRLEHFYTLSFREGGLTWGQVTALYEMMCHLTNEITELKNHELEFQAAIHGAKLESKPSRKVNSESDNISPIFQSPEAYANMSQEEKDKMTEKMMSMHKQWAGQTRNIGG